MAPAVAKVGTHAGLAFRKPNDDERCPWRRPRGAHTDTRSAPLTPQDAQDGVEDGVQLAADVFGKKPEDEVAVLLEQPVLATVPSIGGGIRQVLRAIQFEGEARVGTEEVDLERPGAIERESAVRVFSANRPAVSGSDSRRLKRNASVALRALASPSASGATRPTACTKSRASGVSTLSRIRRRTLPA